MYSSRSSVSLLNLLSSKDSSAKWVHLPFCCRTTFSEFAAKHAKDSRFKAIEKMKDREALFNEFITAARKKEKEDSKTRGEKVRWLFLAPAVWMVQVWVRRDRGSAWFPAPRHGPSLPWGFCTANTSQTSLGSLWAKCSKFAMYCLLERVESNLHLFVKLSLLR